MRKAAIFLILFAACTSNPTAATSSTPRSTVLQTPQTAASAGRVSTSPPEPAVSGVYAVIVKNFLQGGDGYTASLVATDGRTAASVVARRRSRFVQFSSLSTSGTTLYYLDGDGDVRYLRPDGSKGLATHFDLGPNQVIGFAVSPDDKRIAVAVLDYTAYPVSTRLFVEDVAGHANHIELFASKSALEWPAGWHSGRLVIALGINAPPQNAWDGFAHGHGYHIADAQNGNRLLSLCDGGDSYIPESPAGTVCVQYPKASVVSWDGATRAVPMDGTCAMYGPLSPTGVIATRITTTPDGGCTGSENVFRINPDGTQDPRPLARQAAPEGWVDKDHLVVIADVPPFSPADFQPAETIVNVTTGAAATIANPGFFGAALPGGL